MAKRSPAARRHSTTEHPAIERARKLRESLERNFTRGIASKKTRDLLATKGFHVTKRGVVIDSPRDVRGNKVKQTRFRVSSSGTVVFENHDRRDYVVGLTDDERKEFSKFPDRVLARKRQELIDEFPTVRKHVRSLKVRLQWGAFQGTKAFSPTYFSRDYLLAISPEDQRKKYPRSKQRRIDKLTGFHFVIHVTRGRSITKRRKGRKHGKKKK